MNFILSDGLLYPFTREREKLRREREAIERERAELLRLERDRQRLERERLEREKEELKLQQLRFVCLVKNYCNHLLPPIKK